MNADTAKERGDEGGETAGRGLGEHECNAVDADALRIVRYFASFFHPDHPQ